ncbi:MAG TPA: hypothetical protein VIT83_07045 [Gammaproteobacteria bacterium]
MSDESRKALAYGVGGSIILVIVWGQVIVGTPDGALIKPMGEAMVTLVVLALSGLGCLVIGVRQLLNADARHLALLSVLFGALPFITITVIFWWMGAVKNLEFA